MLLYINNTQTITFNPLSNKTYSDPQFAISGTSSSGLPVSFSSSNSLVATVSGNIVTIVGAGTAVITADQSGNTFFNPAPSVQQTLVVNKANQTITFNPLPSKSVIDVPFSLSASSSSGLAVNYVSLNTSVASISGNTVSIVGAGVTTITASQTGNTNYNPASNVQQNLTVNALPIVIVSPSNASVCLGSSVVLNAGGALSYSWSPAAGLSSITGVSVTASPTVTTIYTITGTDINGLTNTATATVTVNLLPTITVSPIAPSICSGTSISLTASGATSYSWSPSTGLSSTTGATVTASPIATTTYTINGTTGGGCVNSTTVTVTVNPRPTITVSPSSVAVCFGSSTTLSASGASSYNWSPSTGLSSTTGANVITNPTVATTYSVVGTDVTGCSNTATVTVSVNAIPISAGGSHSIVLYCGLCGGGVVSNGLNSSGQLGNGTITQRTSPFPVSGLSGTTKAVSAGNTHSLFLKSDGTVWSTGLNTNGQLGDGTLTNKTTPVQISTLAGVTAVSAGTSHSLFLKNDGTVWAVGLNTNGQLGDGTLIQKTIPVQVSGLTGVISISAGGSHSLFLKNDGTVWAVGLNSNGQLGDGTLTRRTVPVLVSSITNTTGIAAGGTHSLFLKNDGSVRATGLNTNGQLGDGTTTRKTVPTLISSLFNITAVSAGSSFSSFLRSDGVVWACGLNTNGQLGDGTLTQRTLPVQVSGLSGITAIEAGNTHALFLKNNGIAYGCGRNANGQLGDGTTTQRTIPVQVISVNPCGRVDQSNQDEIVESAFESELFNVFPNPSNSQLFVQINEAAIEDISIKLYSLIGTVSTQSVIEKGNTTATINTQQLSEGIYIVVLESNSNTSELRRKVSILH